MTEFCLFAISWEYLQDHENLDIHDISPRIQFCFIECKLNATITLANYTAGQKGMHCYCTIGNNEMCIPYHIYMIVFLSYRLYIIYAQGWGWLYGYLQSN